MTKVEFSHLDKIYWPKENYTKGDLLEYYETVAPYLIPHLKNRPVMLKRYPNGIESESFYQKDTSSLHLPEGTNTVSIMQEKQMQYLLIQDVTTLKYAINLGTIEIHPFLARAKHLKTPDFLVIDLDPEDIGFDYVVETALAIREVLNAAKVESYCKTSGGRGLHLFIPVHAKYTFEQTKHFGELIATLVHSQIPEITSLERKPVNRQKKVYIDVYQNNIGQTVVAPYVVRAKPLAPVSTPLKWEEVKKGLTPADFTLKSIPKRISKLGDLYKPVLGKGADLAKALNLLGKKFKQARV